MRAEVQDTPVSFLVQAIRVLDIIQGVFLESSLDEMQYVEDVVVLRSARLIFILSTRRPCCCTYLHGLKRGARLKVPSCCEMSGWNTSVTNWTVGGRSG